MQRRPHLPYGYRTYTGIIPANNQIDEYNRLQDKLNAEIEAIGSISEGLLNASHKLFTMFSMPDSVLNGNLSHYIKLRGLS